MFNGFISSASPAGEQELEALNKRLAAFYCDPKNSEYWIIADSVNSEYAQKTHPFHMHLVELLSSSRGPILDLGCGSAHLATHLQDPTRYLGVDWGNEQIERNRTRLPKSQFVSADLYDTRLEGGRFEWVVSLYVLEHCVFPVKFLKEMARLVQPRGYAVILCPHFRPGPMNSIWNGFLPVRRIEKLNWRWWWDIAPDFWDKYWAMPRNLKNAHETGDPFLIYRDPRCLHAPYWSDTDAVYWTYEPELRQLLQDEGFKIEFDRTAVNPAFTSTVYLVARKEI